MEALSLVVSVVTWLLFTLAFLKKNSTSWRQRHPPLQLPPGQELKIYLSELFSSKRLESYEYIRVEELRAFFSRLFALSGKPVLLKEHLSRVTLSIISRIMLDKKYFSESKFETAVVTLEYFQEMLDELFRSMECLILEIGFREENESLEKEICSIS
ncbi:hypothetical protein Ddye_020411 [Dipteronia dyeriana]|uniref:Uncharacterized protein n=1 Tax=Dipteronia dyeriana TaxID=168575 RepID=A0AAD9U0G7_9ROSI|nr:hypothetical protein Ddye_020411 [Dipteronia dyeriana]